MNCGNGFILQMMLFDKFKFESHMQYCTIFFELHMDTCFSLNLSTNVNLRACNASVSIILSHLLENLLSLDPLTSSCWRHQIEVIEEPAFDKVDKWLIQHQHVRLRQESCNQKEFQNYNWYDPHLNGSRSPICHGQRTAVHTRHWGEHIQLHHLKISIEGE